MKQYKMTVEEFFNKGYKFVDGDSYTNRRGIVMVVGKDVCVGYANARLDTDLQRYVVSAKTLKEVHYVAETGTKFKGKALKILQRLKEKDLSRYDSILDKLVEKSFFQSEGKPIYLESHKLQKVFYYFNTEHFLEKLRLEGFIVSVIIAYENTGSRKGVEQFVISLPEEGDL